MMNTNIFPQVVSILYSLLIIISFFTKKQIKTLENNIFGLLIVGNFFGLILDIVAYIVVKYLGADLFISFLICRCINIYLILWVFTMTIYIYAVSNKITYQDKEANNKTWIKYSAFKKAIVFVEIVVCLGSLVLPLNIVSSNGNFYSYGQATYIIYIISFVLIALWIYLMIRNKNIKNKKLYPMYAYMVLGAITSIFQFYHPYMIIIIPVETFVTILMYFTIENPDIKMLNELYKNKELMEQNYEDKYNFLFEMTQEARKPLVNINNLSNELRMEDDSKKIKEGLLTMNGLVRQLDFSINNILNISSLDIQKVKVVNNKYDLEKICQDLEVRIRNEIGDNVKFNLTMPRRIPTLLGDYMKIRQILYSLLMNACQNTETGSINMKVNLIEKYDVARVIFNISDTGRGMPIDLINEILSTNGSMEPDEINNLEKKEFNLKVCQKVIKIMGGNLMIKSNVGEGTEVVLTIDQGVYHEEDNNELEQYEKAVSYRKVLIVSQNKDKLNIIKKKLSDNNITYSSLYYGMDAIDRIKSGKKYEFILVEDDMKEMSGLMTLKGMQELDDFNMPVIVMLNEDKEHIKEHYLSDGFSDYIILDNLDNELDRIIEKY